ncbi:MAG: hypothetical protein H6R00_1606 [Proteobacteria bacterium]|nr:hypothetical protein [Pseudomonadota bacterium]
MTTPNSTNRIGRSKLVGSLLAVAIFWIPLPSHAADSSRIQRIATELNIPRRAWTICTVNEIGRAVQAEQATDAMAIADQALARCSGEEQALRAKAVQWLGVEAAGRLMERLGTEAREALVGSARTLEAAKASGDKVEPAWPRVLSPTP